MLSLEHLHTLEVVPESAPHVCEADGQVDALVQVATHLLVSG